MPPIDAQWEMIHRQTAWGKYPAEEVVRFVARNFYQRDRAKTALLDAGTGGGSVAWFLAREGFETHAFDGAQTAVEKLRARFAAEGLTAELAVHEASRTGYPDARFDGIIDAAMIYAHRVADVKAILREYHRLLKPGGKAFWTGLFTPATTGWETGVRLEERTYDAMTAGALANRGVAHLFERAEIEALWSEAGFAALVVDRITRTEFGGALVVDHFVVSAERA